MSKFELEESECDFFPFLVSIYSNIHSDSVTFMSADKWHLLAKSLCILLVVNVEYYAMYIVQSYS